MVECGEPERKQPKTITAEVYPDVLWTYTLGLARAGVEGIRDKPSVAETDGSQAYGYMQIPLNDYSKPPRQSELFTACLLRALLPLQCEELIRGAQPLQKQMKMRAVLHPQYLGYISVVLVIAVMYVTKWQDHILPQDSQDHNVASTIAPQHQQVSTAVAHQRRQEKSMSSW